MDYQTFFPHCFESPVSVCWTMSYITNKCYIKCKSFYGLYLIEFLLTCKLSRRYMLIFPDAYGVISVQSQLGPTCSNTPLWHVDNNALHLPEPCSKMCNTDTLHHSQVVCPQSHWSTNKMLIIGLTTNRRKGLWTQDLHGIRLHGSYQVILWFTLGTIIKGVSFGAWLLSHAYSYVCLWKSGNALFFPAHWTQQLRTFHLSGFKGVLPQAVAVVFILC